MWAALCLILCARLTLYKPEDLLNVGNCGRNLSFLALVQSGVSRQKYSEETFNILSLSMFQDEQQLETRPHLQTWLVLKYIRNFTNQVAENTC